MANELIKTRLRDLRDRKGVNQDVVTEACGISRVALTRYENGTRVPRIEIAAKLAEYYGVTVDYILGNDAPAAAASEDPATAEFAENRALLSDDNLVKLRDYMKLLLLQQEAEKRKKD